MDKETSTLVIVICWISQTMINNPRGLFSLCLGIAFVSSFISCKPDESPFKSENENLRRQLVKQESVVTSLQECNNVMLQQIDLLNK